MSRGQEFVIGGYIPGPHGLDSIIVGYYKGQDLIYVARVRNGFVPASRREVFGKLRKLVIRDCPFVNLPEAGKGRWGKIDVFDAMIEPVARWLKDYQLGDSPL